MSGKCDVCGEHTTDCCCLGPKIVNYFIQVPGNENEVKVWAQMFFDDGSVTQGVYIPSSIYQDESGIKGIAMKFLRDTHRIEGVLYIWGAGQIYSRHCKLFKPRIGGQALRLRRL